MVVVYKTGMVFELVELPAASAGLPPARTPYGAFERTLRLADITEQQREPEATSLAS